MLKPPPAPLVRYGVVLPVVALALLLTLLIPPLRDQGRLPLFFAAVVASAWYGGWGPGVVATVFSALASAYWVLPPYDSLAVESVADLFRLGAFVLLGILVSSVLAARQRTERALRAGENRYRHLVESSLGLICTHDLSGIVLSINPAAAHLLGYQASDGIGRNLREFLPADVRHLFDEYLERIRRNGADSGFMRLVAKDGSEVVWMYRNVLLQEEGKPPYILGHAVDTTELKQAREALEKARQQLEIRVAERTSELEQTNEQLRQRVQGDGLVSSMLRRFLSIRLDETDAAIEDSLRQACSVVGADTAFLAHLTEDGRTFHRSHCWHASHVAAIPGLLGEFTLDDEVPWLSGKIDDPDYLFFRQIDDLPEDANVELSRLRLWGVRSVAWIPVRIAGKVNGGIALLWSGQPASIQRNEIAPLVVFADALLSAVRRKESETRQRKAEERFEWVARAANDALWEWDLATDEVWWNEGAEAQFGYLSGIMPGGAWSRERTHPEDWERVVSKLRASITDGAHFWTDEYRYRRANGAYVYVSERAYILRDASGKALRLIGATVDISERKRAEEEVKLLHSITAEIGEAEDLDAALEVALRRICESTGWTLGQAWTRSGEQDALIYRTSWCSAKEPGLEAFRNASDATIFHPGEALPGQVWASRLPFWIKDMARDQALVRTGALADAGLRCGAAFPVIARGEVIAVLEFFVRETRVEDQRLVGLISAVTAQLGAVIHRKLLEEQLRQSQKMEAIGRLAGSVAHDFNNLLTVIIGHGHLLREDIPAGSPLAESTEEILLAAGRGSALTRQLLAFGRREVVQPQELNLNDIVSGMERMLRHIVGEGLELVTTMDPSLHVLSADPNQMEQVILNLVVNARDAMPDGGRLIIQTSNTSEFLDPVVAERVELPPGDYVLLTVSDTGHGMDAETLRHIFEPFYTTKAAGYGTGLGLSTVYGIVKQASGGISVRSQPGVGTTFRVYLPATTQGLARPQGAAAQPADAPIILPVEDEFGVRNSAGSKPSGIHRAGSG